MKTATPLDLLEMSGVPKTDLSWILYLTPIDQTMRLTASSGPVFFERIADMTLLRFSGDRLSAM
jgi:hypothetical protein